MYASEVAGPLICLASLFVLYAVNENGALFRAASARLAWLPRTFHSTPRDAIGRGRSAGINDNDRKAATGKEARPSTFWAFDVLDPRDAVTLRWGTDWLLVFWRLVPATYLAICLLLQVFDEGDPMSAQFLTYFTNWGLMMLSVTGLWGFAVALYYKTSGAEPAWHVGTCGYILLVQATQSCVLFLTAFYWGALYPGGVPPIQDVLRHGINAGIMLIDVTLSRTPVVSYHLLFCFFPVALYSFFMWIYYAITGVFTYAPLAFSSSMSSVYYVVVPLLLTASFYVWFGLVSAREATIRAVSSRSHHHGDKVMESAAEMTSRTGPHSIDLSAKECGQHGQLNIVVQHLSPDERPPAKAGWSSIPL